MENTIKAFYSTLLGHYDNEADLKADYKKHGSVKLIQGGCFAISFFDQRQELEACGFIEEDSEDRYNNYHIYELYEELTDITLEEVLG